MKRNFRYGAYEYEYELISENRKSLKLTVMPSLGIILRAPVDADDQRIKRFLEKKWRWLEKQLQTFERYHKKSYARSYISGESFMYLGRQYELIVARGEIDSVGLVRGKIRVITSLGASKPEYTKMLLESWYRNRRNLIFRDSYVKCLGSFDFAASPKFLIKEMDKRWGSYTNAGNIVLNPRLIEADKRAIEYVIVHELCHASVRNHGPQFISLLNEKLPNWREVKDRLELRHG